MSEYDFLKIFESIIDEADVSDQESEKQDSISKDLSHHKASKSKKKKDTIKDKKSQKNIELDLEEEEEQEDNEDTESSQESSDEPKKDSQDIKVSTEFSDFIKSANALRATRSFKDKDVKDDLATYFKSLSTGEKESLYIFFKGLTQIAGSDVDGDKAPAPHKFGIKTSQKKDASKPSVEKKPSKDQEKESSNPITVGESVQDKNSILKLLAELNRK